MILKMYVYGEHFLGISILICDNQTGLNTSATYLVAYVVEHLTRGLGGTGSDPGQVCHYFSPPRYIWCCDQPLERGTDRKTSFKGKSLE